MGFNISGLVINKNYKSDFEALQKELGWNLEKQGEISFEEASSNWKDDGICDAYFTDNGTLLFISMDMCSEGFGLKEANTLTFALSETSMAFNLNYCEKGVEKRSIMAVEDNRMSDEGEPLEVESRSEDISEIIWNQMDEVLGKSFWSIDPGEKAERYVFVKEKKQPPVTSNVDRTRELLEKSPAMRAVLEEELQKRQATASPQKKWWEFWK